jgi:hypothetical protein
MPVLQSVLAHAIKIDDEGRFGDKDKAKVNVAPGLLNFAQPLFTGHSPELGAFSAAWDDLPYA